MDRYTGEMKVCDSKGDTRITWNADNRDEVLAAKKVFDDLISKGFKAFKVNKEGKPADPISVWDPKVEALILVPRVVGG